MSPANHQHASIARAASCTASHWLWPRDGRSPVPPTAPQVSQMEQHASSLVNEVANLQKQTAMFPKILQTIARRLESTGAGSSDGAGAIGG